MHWKQTAAVTGVTLIGAWVAGTPQAPPALTPPVARSASNMASAAAATVDIAEEARRLQARVGRRLQRESSPAVRNPFRFGEARPARAVLAPTKSDAEPDAVEAPPPTRVDEAPEPTLRLIGMATDEIDGTVLRTAVISTTQGVVLARVGELVGAYRVGTIEADAVELSAPDGRTRRITLTP